MKWIGFLMVLVLAACIPTTGSPQAPQLEGMRWTLESYGPVGSEEPVIPGSNVTLGFDVENAAGGNTGCNSYGSTYTIQDGTIQFTEIVSTLMACADEAVMEQEREFLQALESAGQFELSEDRLTIHYNEGQGRLNFVRATQ